MINRDRSRLLLSEYGRNVQKMVNYLKTIPDREQRNRQAEVVVAIMGNVNPAQKDSEKFQHMLWDHLFMIADFDLDVDAPYPKPTPAMFAPNPQRVPYTQTYIAQKQYGIHVLRMLRSLSQAGEPDHEKRDAAATNVAKYMRQKSYEYNHEYPQNEMVIHDIANMSDGVIRLDADSLDTSRVDTSRGNTNNSGKKNNRSNGNGNHTQKKYTKKNNK